MKRLLSILFVTTLVFAGLWAKFFWVRTLTNLKPFADLRGPVLNSKRLSLANADFRGELDMLLTTSFDSRTEWPSPEMLPAGFKPQDILEMSKDPGLGVRELHAQGITGKGIKVAIIDQPLLQGHVEYKDKLAMYTTIECEKNSPQMHGAAVASLLVGEACGVAPGASLYYWAEPSWKASYKQRIQALEEILDLSKTTQRLRHDVASNQLACFI